MLIRSRRVGNQPDSILFLERPTHFPRALAPFRFTARFRGPSTPFTVHSLHSQSPPGVANCCSLEGFAPRVETAGVGLGGTKACAKHQDRPMCTARPTLLNKSVGLSGSRLSRWCQACPGQHSLAELAAVIATRVWHYKGHC